MLHPMLLLVYINNLPNVSQFVRFILYADDKTILIPLGNKFVHDNDHFAQSIVDMVAFWFIANRLVINEGKTNVVHFLHRIMLLIIHCPYL